MSVGRQILAAILTIGAVAAAALLPAVGSRSIVSWLFLVLLYIALAQ